MCQKKNEIMLKRLKGKSNTKGLFENGKSYRYKNLLLKLEKNASLTYLAVGISVSKKNFARAVDRNSIKRQLRNALKEVKKNVRFCGFCMVLYTGKELPKKDALIKHLIILLKKACD